MKLENLVPPVELCQKIPAGEFAESAFYWFEELQKMNEKPPHDYRFPGRGLQGNQRKAAYEKSKFERI